VAVVPLWVFGCRWILKKGEPAGVIAWAGLALLAFFYFNRFFQPNYLLTAAGLIAAGLLGRLGVMFDREVEPDINYSFAP
jgi:hypothetical protein